MGRRVVMIRQTFSIKNFWEVTVFYNINYDLFDIIAHELYALGMDEKELSVLYDKMHSSKAKAATYSNERLHKSVVLFNRHNNVEDYINSIVHEAEHIKQAMLRAYNVEDKGEPPAYTIGYLVSKMYAVFNKYIRILQ